MRIISGKYKGKQLHLPKNLRARPTTDFAKTGLFNILSNKYFFDELEILDLFSGTGSIGLEFASRGAAYIEMVEKNYIHYSFIKRMIQELALQNSVVFKTDVFIYLPKIRRKFDIIFADPPYEMEDIADFPDLIFSYELLKDDGILILEHGGDIEFSSNESLTESRNYGNVHFSFFKKHV